MTLLGHYTSEQNHNETLFHFELINIEIVNAPIYFLMTHVYSS